MKIYIPFDTKNLKKIALPAVLVDDKYGTEDPEQNTRNLQDDIGWKNDESDLYKITVKKIFESIFQLFT